MATYKVNVTALHDESGHVVCSYLLEVDSVRIMLDCGWDESFNTGRLKQLESVASTVDLVLLTHPEIAHLGALPYLMGHCGLKAPVYCTAPVQKMGEMLMLDHYFSRHADEEFDVYNLDDVISAFRGATTLKYNQSRRLQGKMENVTIIPHLAGHSLGGTVWVVRVGGEEIVYAPVYNNKRERLLNGSALESLFTRPAALLTHTAWYLKPPSGDRVGREKQLTDLILATVRGDGNVLMPVDSSARVLELVLLLENFWHDNKMVYPLVLLTKISDHTLELAGSQLQWCGDQLCRTFEQHLDNPFDFKADRDKKDRKRYMHRLHHWSELAALPPGPKVVLASPPSMLAGASRTLLLQWGGDARSAIILTQTGQSEVVERLLSHSQAASRQLPLEMRLEVRRKVPLEGQELEEHLARKQQGEGGGDVQMEDPLAGGGQADAARAGDRAGSPLGLGGGGSRGGGGAGSGELRPLRSNSSSISRLLKVESGAVVQKLEGGGGGLQGGHQVLLDGFAPPLGARFAMFPDEEGEVMDWTPYGMKLDLSMFGTPEMGEGAAPKEAEEEEEEEEEEVEEPPCKTVMEQVDLSLRAQVRYINFEGRVDGGSLRTVTNTLAPRHLVLLGGASAPAAALEAACSKQLAKYDTTFYTPGYGRKVEMVLGPVRGVGLQEGLLDSLVFTVMQGHRMAWMDARVTAAATQESLPQLGPREGDGPSSQHGGVFLSDAKLHDVAGLLAKRGLDCSYAGASVLSCRGGRVLIKKEEGGQLALEGSLCEEYFTVRDVLYSQYRIC